jgi:hypothetical protein
MDEARLQQLTEYIRRHLSHLDKYMRPMFEPKGKRVLILGSGWGTETYWCLLNGAREVVGIDPASRPTLPIETALREAGPELVNRFRHVETVLNDLPTDTGFDALISNNVFEHIADLAGTFHECRRFMTRPGQRLHIFTDPLFYSSPGSHLPVPPWEHLRQPNDEALRVVAGEGGNWLQWRNGLNRMNLGDFLEAAKREGMYLEYLSIIPDRNRKAYRDLAPGFVVPVMPMDALLEGISCTLAFPQNI